MLPEIENIALAIPIHKHVPPVGDTEVVENITKCLDASRKTSFTRGSSFEPRVQDKVSLPHNPA